MILLISNCAFSESDQEKFCESAQLSIRLPMIADKILSASRGQIEDFEYTDPFSQKNETLKLKERQRVRNLEYTDICNNKEFIRDFGDDLSYVYESVEYLSGVRVKGSNPSLKCIEINKPPEQWRKLLQAQTQKLCEGMKKVGEGYKCKKKGAEVISFIHAAAIKNSKKPKSQCILMLKQISAIVERIDAK